MESLTGPSRAHPGTPVLADVTTCSMRLVSSGTKRKSGGMLEEGLSTKREVRCARPLLCSEDFEGGLTARACRAAPFHAARRASYFEPAVPFGGCRGVPSKPQNQEAVWLTTTRLSVRACRCDAIVPVHRQRGTPEGERRLGRASDAARQVSTCHPRTGIRHHLLPWHLIVRGRWQAARWRGRSAMF